MTSPTAATSTQAPPPRLSSRDLRKLFPNLGSSRLICRRASAAAFAATRTSSRATGLERHRVVAAGTGAHTGKWRNSRTPYLRRNHGLPCGVAPCAPRDLAKFGADRRSEMISNVLLWAADAAPAPILVVHPTIEAGREWTNDKFDPAVESTPRAKRKIAEHVVRGKAARP